MRAFLLFCGLTIFALLIAALVTYPAWLTVGLVSIEPVHRVMHRVAMLVAIVGFVLLVRHLRIADRRSLGYGLSRPAFLQELGLGLAIGSLLLLPLLALLLGLELRILRPGLQLDFETLLAAVGRGVATGLAVAFIEETFFRGAMQTAITRESGHRLAIWLPSLLYASMHFLGGRLRIAPQEVSWGTGFQVLANLGEKYRDPLALVDSFAALVVVGLLLAVVRRRTGSIAACIGLHAGWVCLITVLRSITVRNDDTALGWLVGSYDGVIGWLACLWTLGILWAASRWLPTRHRDDSPAVSVGQ